MKLNTSTDYKSMSEDYKQIVKEKTANFLKKCLAEKLNIFKKTTNH